MATGDGSSILDWTPLTGPFRAFSGDGGDSDGGGGDCESGEIGAGPLGEGKYDNGLPGDSMCFDCGYDEAPSDGSSCDVCGGSGRWGAKSSGPG